MELKEALQNAIKKDGNAEMKTAASITKPKIDLSIDGKTHIWVSPVGNTRIGKLAYINWNDKFYVPQLGNFASVANFVKWIITFDETVRFGKITKTKRDAKESSYKDMGRVVIAAQRLGKYHQMCAYYSDLVKAKEDGHFDLDWYAYKRHKSGVKELHKRSIQDLVNVTKKIAEAILEHGPKEAVNNNDNLSKYRKTIMDYVSENVAKMESVDSSEATESSVMEKAIADPNKPF
jgi:hypothetical protein